MINDFIYNIYLVNFLYYYSFLYRLLSKNYIWLLNFLALYVLLNLLLTFLSTLSICLWYFLNREIRWNLNY